MIQKDNQIRLQLVTGYLWDYHPAKQHSHPPSNVCVNVLGPQERYKNIFKTLCYVSNYMRNEFPAAVLITKSLVYGLRILAVKVNIHYFFVQEALFSQEQRVAYKISRYCKKMGFMPGIGC
jgi:hypothetical protein